MTFLSVVKRMAKGSVMPLFWILVLTGAIIGTTGLIANFVQTDPKEIYMFVWLGYMIAIGLYWAYGWTKWEMEWEQKRIERELKYTETKSETWEVGVEK